jgi:hypothetical protein
MDCEEQRTAERSGGLIVLLFIGRIWRNFNPNGMFHVFLGQLSAGLENV